MEKAKSFKTINEQIEILESRNVIVDDREAARQFLLRNSYYSLVNGYKDFFLDKDRTNRDVEVYRDGTTFAHLATLYRFDNELRLAMMRCLTIAEKAMKTATVHAFCHKFPDPEDYLDPSSYCLKKDYRGKEYTANLIRLLSTLQGIRDGRGDRRPYIEHYRRKYGFVPLWVVANALTFGNMSHFYSLQKIGVQNETCHLICKSIDRDVISAKTLRGIYSTLTAFRNTCAHGGRLFCKRSGKRGDKRFVDMLNDLSTVSTRMEMDATVISIMQSLSTLEEVDGLRSLVEKEMGLTETKMMKLLECPCG